MPRPTVDVMFNVLRNTNQFFSVEFKRRTARPDGTAVEGDTRKMLCRAAGTMEAYKLGVIPTAARDEEDFRHAILTVWSMDAYMAQIRRGVERQVAAWNAWRRIDLTTVTQLSAMPLAQLPPDIRRNVHDITNAYRLANLPRRPI